MFYVEAPSKVIQSFNYLCWEQLLEKGQGSVSSFLPHVVALFQLSFYYYFFSLRVRVFDCLNLTFFPHLDCKVTVWKKALIHVYFIHSLPNC